MYEHCLLILWRLFKKSSLCNLVDNRQEVLLTEKALTDAISVWDQL
jgi:hypothetical protein